MSSSDERQRQHQPYIWHYYWRSSRLWWYNKETNINYRMQFRNWIRCCSTNGGTGAWSCFGMHEHMSSLVICNPVCVWLYWYHLLPYISLNLPLSTLISTRDATNLDHPTIQSRVLIMNNIAYTRQGHCRSRSNQNEYCQYRRRCRWCQCFTQIIEISSHGV